LRSCSSSSIATSSTSAATAKYVVRKMKTTRLPIADLKLATEVRYR
jgi:hypothetical protein